MRKRTLFALTAATVFATTASPLLVQASTEKAVCEKLQKNGCVVVGGTVVTNKSECKELLDKLGVNLNYGSFGDCFSDISIPDTVLPDNNGTEEKPETDAPETEKPENGTDIPEQENNENSSFAKQVVKLVNEERVKAGLHELTIDTQIEAAALIRAKEMKQSFSHTRPDGSSFSTALKEQGVSYKGAGENIAWGQKTPEEVMKGWMNSEGHRANILNPKFTKIGVGFYQDANGRNYWTQLFTY